MWYAIATARLLSTGVANLATTDVGAPWSARSNSISTRHSTPSMPMPSPTGVVATPVTIESPIAPAARSAPVIHSGVTSAGDVGYERVLMGSPPRRRRPPRPAAHHGRARRAVELISTPPERNRGTG